MKRLIINADDFGLHIDINKGIIESHLKGCVTSTTIMAGGDAFEDAVLLAKQCPKLSVGVHLTLVGARPAARGDIRTLLTGDGLLPSNYKDFLYRYVSGLISKQHIEHELRCQMQKVVGSGIKVSHIDSHQHLHALPGISEIVVKIAKEFDVTKIRQPAESCLFFGVDHFTIGRIIARNVLTGCSIYSHRKYKKKNLFSPEHFFGMLSGGTMNMANLKSVISNLPDGVSEIMVHPASSNEVLSKLYNWGYHWQEECEALKNETVLQTIQDDNVKLINYWELPDETN